MSGSGIATVATAPVPSIPLTPLVHANLLPKLNNFFPSLCTIQYSIESTSTSGHRTSAWGDTASLTDIPCRIATAGASEPRKPNMTYTINTYVIVLKGHYPAITTLMRVRIVAVSYNILSVEHDSQGLTTRLIAELIT